MAIFILKRAFDNLASRSRAEIIEKMSEKEGLVAGHLLMYMTVDLTNNKDEKIAHWSDSEIPIFTAKAAEGFNPDRWKMADFKYVFPTFVMNPSSLSHTTGADMMP